MSSLCFQATIVTQEFETLRVQLQRERELEVYHSGVSTKTGIVFVDMMDAEAMYNKDPMTKIRKWADQEGLRLVDIFQRFDKDKSWTVDREEFIMGIRVCMDGVIVYRLDMESIW